MPHPELITFGETMVVLDPVQKGPLRNVAQFNKRFGGAESNVSIGVVRLGHTAGWISQVSDDELGDYLVNSIRGEGVDTSQVKRTSDAPTGLYIKERIREGANQVYYYRKNSAASLLSKEQIDWGYLKEAKIIHVSGITPFLSESCRDLTKEIVHFAKENDIFISFDPNLRYKIMASIENHKEIIMNIAKQADLFMPGIDEASYLFGIKEPDTIFESCKKMGMKNVILKDGANGSYFMGGLEKGFVSSIKVDKVVDPVGAGDGFAAGVLTALLEGKSLKAAVERGSVVGAMVVTVAGDMEGLPTIRQMDQFLASNQDVQR